MTQAEAEAEGEYVAALVGAVEYWERFLGRDPRIDDLADSLGASAASLRKRRGPWGRALADAINLGSVVVERGRGGGVRLG